MALSHSQRGGRIFYFWSTNLKIRKLQNTRKLREIFSSILYFSDFGSWKSHLAVESVTNADCGTSPGNSDSVGPDGPRDLHFYKHFEPDAGGVNRHYLETLILSTLSGCKWVNWSSEKLYQKIRNKTDMRTQVSWFCCSKLSQLHHAIHHNMINNIIFQNTVSLHTKAMPRVQPRGLALRTNELFLDSAQLPCVLQPMICHRHELQRYKEVM